MMEIEIKDLDVSLGGKKIVQDIAIALKKGEFIGLLGPNGSGKSTILKVLYRILKKDSGKVFFDGMELENISVKENAQKLGVMKQSFQLPFDFQVIDLVMLGRTPYKGSMELNTEEDYVMARNSLKAVGMEEYEKRSWNSLSGGEQQRVMVARILTGQPQALLLDELTNHLDVYYQFLLLDLIKSMKLETIAVMHDLNMAANYCDRLYFLKEGKLIASGPTKEVLTDEIIQKVFNVKSRVTMDETGKLSVSFLGL